jgi:choline monooxygenase
MIEPASCQPPGDSAWTLPASWYRDPDRFRCERERIFAREWLLYGRSAELDRPGAYLARTVAGYPLLVVRDEEGRLRGFHNVCRHRGAMLAAEGSGQFQRVITCPYHSWSYLLSGRLKKATDFGAVGGALDPECWGLHAVAAAEWRGLVFVRVAPEGPGLIEWLGRIAPDSANYPFDTQVFFGAREREVAVDWKVYGENYLECYHCRVVHPALCASLDLDRYTIDIDEAGKIFRLYGPRREGGLTDGLYFYRFPFLMLNFYQWGSSIITLEPLGPGRMRHVNWYFVADAGAEKSEENRRNVEWSGTIVTEDLGIVTGIQRNLEAGIFDRGLLSPRHEYAVRAFQEMVRQSL